MKKFLFLSLLLSVNCWAGVSPRLDSLRSRAFEQIDVPSGGSGRITTAVGTSAINRAISYVCSHAPAIEKIDTLYVDSISEGATLPSNFNRVKSAEMIHPDSLYRIPLMPVEADSQFKETPTLDQLVPDPSDPLASVHYRTFGGIFKLRPPWPRSDSATIILEYYADDSVLTVSASQTQVKPKWRECIINYAASLLSAKRNNFDDALYYLNLCRTDLGMPPLKREEYLEK